jgi:hypothetical protein
MPAASQAYPRSVAASAYAFGANFASPNVIKAVCDLLSVAPKINACSCSRWATSSASASFPRCSKALLRSVVKVFRDKLTSASGLASVLFVENFCLCVALVSRGHEPVRPRGGLCHLRSRCAATAGRPRIESATLPRQTICRDS